jgi:hypothetical protein
MSDLAHIRKVVARVSQAAEITNIPRVVSDIDNQIDIYAKEIESRLPELDEYLRVEALPAEARREFLYGDRESAEYKAFQAGYRLLGKIKYFPKLSYVRLHNLGAGNLFLALLQKYEMPPTIRKKVETAAKFWSKSRVGDPKKGTEVAAFKKTMQMYRDHLALAKTAMAQSVDRSTAAPDQVKTWTAGPFRLLNTGGFDDKTMEDCVQVVEKAAQLMRSKGLAKVLYGDVLISNTVNRKSSILAFYLTSKDEMFVRANLKGVKHDATYTVIHELGHRLQFKFLSSKDRQIDTMYEALDRKSKNQDREKLQAILNDPKIRPQPGDTVTDQKGLTFAVDSVVYDTVHLHLVEEPKVKARVPLLGYAQLKNIRVDVPERSGFVTFYAGKDSVENFAEMVANYCFDTLPEDQVEMLEAIIR